MKTKIENEVFFIDEKKLVRALSEMKSFCNACNKILDILRENDLEITPMNAMELVDTPFDSLHKLIVSNWQKQRRNDLTGIELQTKNPNLGNIQALQNNLVHIGAYNSGIIPRDFLMFKNGKFETDEIKLKDFFTLYKTPEIVEIAEKAGAFLTSFEQLKQTGKKYGIKNLIDTFGILHFDPVHEVFTFNKTSPDLFHLKKNFENNKK